MKFTVSQTDLAAALSRGGAVAPKSHTSPVVTHVRLSVSDGDLHVASTDLDRFASATTPVENGEDGAITVPATALSALIGRHPKGAPVTAELDGASLVVKCGRSRVKLPTLPAADFPAFADKTPDSTFIVDGKTLIRLLSSARPATVPTGIVHPALQGVFLHVRDGRLRAAATNRFTIAVASAGLPEGAEGLPGVVLPNECVDAVLRAFKDSAEVRLLVSKTVVKFGDETMTLASKLIDGTFPDYMRPIPARGGSPIAFSRRELLDALGRATLWVGEGQFGDVSLHPQDGAIKLTTRNEIAAEGAEEIEAVVGEGFQAVRLNPANVVTIIGGLNADDVVVEQTNLEGPHLVYSPSDEGFFGVFSPLKGRAE